MKTLKQNLIITITAIIFLVLIIPSFAFAEDKPISIVVNGETVSFSVPPTIINGSTFVPFRSIFEKLGLTVGWDGKTHTITGTKEDFNLTLQIGNNTATLNGHLIQLESAPSIISDSTFVPLRFVAESTGSMVTWDDVNRTVIIGTKKLPTKDKLIFLEKNKPYVSQSDQMTVTVTSIIINEREGFNEYTVNYELQNNTKDKKVDEGTFKITFKNGEEEQQYGFFGILFPTEKKTRSYTYKVLKKQEPFYIEYQPVSQSTGDETLKWEVK